MGKIAVGQETIAGRVDNLAQAESGSSFPMRFASGECMPPSMMRTRFGMVPPSFNGRAQIPAKIRGVHSLRHRLRRIPSRSTLRIS